LDIGVLGYIGIVWPKEHSSEVWSVPPVTPCIYINACSWNSVFYVQKSVKNNAKWFDSKRELVLDVSGSLFWRKNCLVFRTVLEWFRPLGRPRRRWEDNIKMDLQKVEWGGRDWIELDQDRDRWRALVNAVMNLRVP